MCPWLFLKPRPGLPKNLGKTLSTLPLDYQPVWRIYGDFLVHVVFSFWFIIVSDPLWRWSHTPSVVYIKERLATILEIGYILVSLMFVNKKSHLDVNLIETNWPLSYFLLTTLAVWIACHLFQEKNTIFYVLPKFCLNWFLNEIGWENLW